MSVAAVTSVSSPPAQTALTQPTPRESDAAARPPREPAGRAATLTGVGKVVDIMA